jgi:hypothetical protein
MPRRRRVLSNEPDQPVLLCSLEGPSCIKIDGEGSGKITFTFDATQTEVIARLARHYREQFLHLCIVQTRQEEPS